jgi:pimeloyl-ACP methyl ester carboxylesterase
VDGPHRTPDQTPPAVREACRAMALRTVHNHHASTGKPLARDAAARLEEIAVPTLFLMGELDLADVLRVVDDAHRRMPRAERIDMPGVAHMPGMERPEAFNEALLAHLARHP